MTRKELNDARRLAAETRDKWIDIDRDIYCEGQVIGTMKTPRLAHCVAAIHNCFLPVLTKMVMALRRLKDVEAMERDDA